MQSESGAANVVLCLPGGGASGALFQVAALAAFERCLQGFEAGACAGYVGSSSGASLAAVLAAGKDVQRLYRALLDPADDYFPLERKHILHTDLVEWRRRLESALVTLGQGSKSLWSKKIARTPSALWEELSRLYDSLPAGLFSLDSYERFLEEHFLRREVPNRFDDLPRPLRIIACDLDSGQPVLFGQAALSGVPVSRACVASMATPPLFSPVRVADRYYFNAGPTPVSHVDVAIEMGAKVIVVLNPFVRVEAPGRGMSIRDKGALWITSQAHRIQMHDLLWRSIESARKAGLAKIVVVEPETEDGTLLLYNPTSFAARRTLLESSYLYTCRLLASWVADGQLPLQEAGWQPRSIAP